MAREFKECDEEMRERQRTSDSTRHAVSGRCAGALPEARQALAQCVTELHRRVERNLPRQGADGVEVMHLLRTAKAAVDAESKGEEPDDKEWTGLRQLLAGELPAWRADTAGKEAPRKVIKEVIEGVRGAQAMASVQVHSSLAAAAKANKHRQEREGARTWLRVVMLAWREEVEHSASSALRRDPQRWIVRQVGDECRLARGRRIEAEIAAQAKANAAAERATRQTRDQRCIQQAAQAAKGQQAPSSSRGKKSRYGKELWVKKFVNFCMKVRTGMRVIRSPENRQDPPPQKQARSLMIHRISPASILAAPRRCKPSWNRVVAQAEVHTDTPQPQRVQPARTRHTPTTYVAEPAPSPRVAHEAARSMAALGPGKAAKNQATSGRVVDSYKEARIYVMRDVTTRMARVGPKRKESTTKAARMGMWLQGWIRDCGRNRRTGIG